MRISATVCTLCRGCDNLAWFRGLGCGGLVSGAGFTGLRILSLPFSGSVDFGKLLSFSVPQSPSVKWELQSRVTVRSK